MNSDIICKKCGKKLSPEELEKGCSFCNEDIYAFRNVKILSFIIPGYGLLLYAINIGRDSKRSQKVALDSLNWFLYSIIAWLIILFIINGLK